MLGKDKPKTYDVFVIGEQIRCQMNQANMIKDRRYHLRKYRKCFVGRDAVDWLLRMHHAQSRSEAVMAMRCLQEHGMIRHVVDDHVFKDHNLFYRFTRDDETYRLNTELLVFYQGLEVFDRLKEAGIRRDFYHRGHLYQGAFYGCELVDCLQNEEEGYERSHAVKQCRELLEYDIIKHVTDDYHFNDDRLMYQFRVDYDRPCLLSDVLQPFTRTGSVRSSVTAPVATGRVLVELAEEAASESGSVGSSSFLTQSSMPMVYGFVGCDTVLRAHPPPSALLFCHLLPVCKLEGTAFLHQDEVGYGFVLRGAAPCYVHTIDPLGPAAAAGLKVGQYVISIGGQSVVKQDHRYVGRLVMQHSGDLSLIVMTTPPIRDC
ncbi:hypothetical protein BaRGS_00018242 [Batillaria attramentaria]|uniref:DEP domain-containing mTOR-interacting protein n=1 Tax=Batillaria attramentaria TaxID=370345 RepID=A0ABD0KTP9_9CAEN